MCKAEFSLLLDRKIYPHVGILNSFSKENRHKSQDFPVDEYQEPVKPFIEMLQKHGYIETPLYLARHTLTALYLFLENQTLHGYDQQEIIGIKRVMVLQNHQIRLIKRCPRLRYGKTGRNLIVGGFLPVFDVL